MSQVLTLEWTIPEEVQTFAEEKDVAAYLPALLDLTRQVFPTARRQAVYVEEDPEIADERQIVIEVDAPLNLAQARAARRQWNTQTLKVCPTPLICLFCLSIDLVDQ